MKSSNDSENKFVIRHAIKTDISDIVKIEDASFMKPYSRRIFERMFDSYPNCFLVAELDNVIVGYIIGRIESKNVGHLISIAVCPSKRREGIGEKLTLEAIHKLTELGAINVRLECRESNLPAQKMYEKMGFKFVDTLFQYYGNENARIYVMSIK